VPTRRRLALLAAAWLVAVLVLAPALVWLVYDQGVWPGLRSWLDGLPRVDRAFLLEQIRGMAIWGSAAWLALAVLWCLWLRPDAARWIEPATPTDLGAMRILVGGVILISLLWEDVASSARLPEALVHPMGIIHLLHSLPGFTAFTRSESALAAFEWVATLAAAAAMVGWRTRWSLPLAAVGYGLCAGLLRQYAWFYHTGLIPLYLLTVLCFLPAGAGLSVDRWLRARAGLPVVPDEPSSRFGAARYIVWMAMALPYVAAGFSKLRNGGLEWFSARNFQYILYYSTLRPMEFDFDVSLALVEAPEWLFVGMALSAVIGEATYGAVLFSRRARLVLPATMLLMHVGILLLQNILFFDLIILQALFLDLGGIWRKVRGVAVAAPAAIDDSAWGTRRQRRIAVALSATLVLFWVLRLEFYPLTAMQMFSKVRGPVVVWETATAQRSDGGRMRAPIEQSIPAMADSRYRRILQRAIGPEGSNDPTVQAFFEACARAWNEQATPAERIVAFEVTRWRWDYEAESLPADGEPGTAVATRRYVIGSELVAVGTEPLFVGTELVSVSTELVSVSTELGSTRLSNAARRRPSSLSTSPATTASTPTATR
jgi:hypothetical protein